MHARMNDAMARRVLALSFFLLFWLGVIVVRLVSLQLLDYRKYSGRVKAQSEREYDLIPKRGTIFDSRGEILAISVKAKSLAFRNRDTELSLRLLERVWRVIQAPSGQKVAVTKRLRGGDKFVWVKRKLEDSEYGALQAMTVSAAEKEIMDFVDEYRRVYPQKQTAAHILGGVGIDEQPLCGVEQSLDSVIRGKGGKYSVQIDARRKIFQTRLLEEAIPGRDIHLTIDSALQYFVEQALAEAVSNSKALGGAAVVLEAQTGRVLAMASNPVFFPEEISRAFKENRETVKNRAVSFLYDPGSTFKVILAAAALESRTCTPDEIIDCGNGTLRVHDLVISDVHTKGQLSFTDVIVHSSNVGAAKVGMRLGADNYYRWIRRFGFGDRSGIPLPGEEAGLLWPPKRWTEVSIAYLAHGYEINVTPLQMARAFNVLAAGGRLLKPEILQGVAGEERRPQPGVPVLSPQTLQQMEGIMRQVVSRGTGTKAEVDGLEIAGKTGTAQKVKDHRYTKDHIASFGGFFPVQRPRITIFVVIDEPVGAYYGGDVAAPVFRAIAEKIIYRMNMFPETGQEREIRMAP